MQLSESRILLTGASGGIGQALVEQLCAAGAQLLLAGRQGPVLDGLAQRYPGQVRVVHADLREPQGREAVVAAARAFGGLNGLVNAAGVNQFGLLQDQDDEAVARMIDLNVTATILLTQRLLPLLQQQPRALLVNVGSTFGSIGYPGYAAYCASKFALRGFTEALRRELADGPVKVFYVAPRATRTAMNAAPVVAMNEALKVAMDEPKDVAAQIVRAIALERPETYLGWPEKLFVRVNALLPRLVDQSLRKQLPIIRRFARQDS